MKNLTLNGNRKTTWRKIAVAAFLALAAFGVRAEDAYVQSSGTSFINTGYIPNPATRLELDYALYDVHDDAGTTQTRLMGNGGTGSTLPMIVYVGGNVGNGDASIAFAFGDRNNNNFDGNHTRVHGTGTRGRYVDEVRRTAVIDNPGKKAALFQDGVQLWECVRTDHTYVNTSKSPLGLFGDPKTSAALEFTNASKLRVYELKIYENDVLVHDFKPYKQGGWPGLRDAVTGLFVSDDRTNAAAVEYGGDIEEGDDAYIASKGNCAVNLRQHFGPKTKYEIDFALVEESESSTVILGSWQGKGSRLYVQGNAEKTLAVAYGNSWTVYFNTQWSPGTRRLTCSVDALNRTAFYRIGATTNKINTALAAMTVTSDQPLALFATADANSGTKGATFSMKSKAKVYRCRIWEDGSLVHDYKPCVKGGAAGFKDLVDGAFIEGESTNEAERLTYGGPVMQEDDDGYIEVAGEDCTIDTGYVCSSKTRLEADFAFTSNATKNDTVNGRTLPDNPALFGIWDGEAVNFTVYNNSSRKYGWSAQTNVIDWTNTDVPTTITRKTVILDAANATRVLMTAGYTNKTASMNMATNLVRGTYSLPLFNHKRKGSLQSAYYPYVKLYRFRIFEDGVLQKDLVPYMKDGIAGLRDEVSGNFLSAGEYRIAPKAGGAIASDGAEESAYIEANGTQAIDTGYHVSNKSRIEVDFRSLSDKNDGAMMFAAFTRGENRCVGPYWQRVDNKNIFNMGLYSPTWTVTKVADRDMQRHTAILDAAAKNFYFVTGTETNTVAIPNAYSSATPATDSLNLLGNITNSVISRGVHARVYAFRIYEEGQLIHHYLPYSDGETVGFCDVAAEGNPIKTKFGGNELAIGGIGWGADNAAFYTAPKDVTLAPDTTERLTAFAPGAVAYQWFCDGVEIKGATGQTLDIDWRRGGGSVVYTVRATFNQHETAATRDVSATVTFQPRGLIIRLQ